MTPDPRTELLAALERLGRLYPHWRFGQLVANLAGFADAGIWDVEDEHLLYVAREHLAHRAAVLAGGHECVQHGADNP